MPRPTVPTDDRLLTAKECAERAHVPESAWWGIAGTNLALIRGRRVFRRRTFWLASAVTRFLHALPCDAENPRAAALAGKGAL